MPISSEQLDDHSILRLEGACTVSSAAEMKSLLLAGLGSGKELRVDLERAEEIDITVLQLLWAAEREARRTGGRMAVCVSEAMVSAASQAGFERFPGRTVEG